ncbi:unnamed protein product [Paramecium sonneborni]|uniref:Transmembrane protein n=1 Tax=Paramecium sonneborni TaxID=65129 RepID=A0A8S1RTL7_9CILI|nr:unnamed protein product [Paramecium sonneborni]
MNLITQTIFGCEILFEFLKTIREINLIHSIIPLDIDRSRLLKNKELPLFQENRLISVKNQNNKHTALLQHPVKSNLYSNQLIQIQSSLGGLSQKFQHGLIISIFSICNIPLMLNYSSNNLNRMIFYKLQISSVLIHHILFQAPKNPRNECYFILYQKYLNLYLFNFDCQILLYLISFVIVVLQQNKLNANQQKSHKLYIFTKCSNQLYNQQPTLDDKGMLYEFSLYILLKSFQFIKCIDFPEFCIFLQCLQEFNSI